VTGLATTFGSGAMTNSIDEIEGAQAILVVGSNTAKTHPQVARRITRALENGAKLVVIDPRRSPLSRRAHIHLDIRPGSDIPLLNAMMRIILDENLADEAFIEMRTENFHALRDMLFRLDLDECAALTGVPLEKIGRAAKMYARAHNAVICYCLGITQHICGTDNVQAIANLAMLTGNVEKENTGVDPLRGQNNVQGACDMGALPGVFPGYQPVADAHVRDRFSRAWGTELPEAPGLTATEMSHPGPDNPIRAMFIMGENPMISDPALGLVRQGLGDLEFLAVSDIFLTETAALADVVLPAVTFAEKDGTFTNTERRVQLVRQAIEPLGESKSDLRIISELSRELSYPMEYESSAEVMEEIALLTPIYGGMFHDRLSPWGLQWPCKDRGDGGTPFLHKYSFARGRGRFIPVAHQEPGETPDSAYPLTLITGRNYHQYHTGTMSRKTPRLNRECGEGLLEITPADAEARGIGDGDLVRLRSRRGEIVARASVCHTVNPGTVFMPFHFSESQVNQLTTAARDPLAKCPEYKVCAVDVMRHKP